MLPNIFKFRSLTPYIEVGLQPHRDNRSSLKCMNQLLFERSYGGIGPNALARLESTRLLKSFRLFPRLRYDGGERGVAGDGDDGALRWAHQAGVNALALERFDGRM